MKRLAIFFIYQINTRLLSSTKGYF